MLSRTASLTTAASSSISATLADAKAAKILLPTATPRYGKDPVCLPGAIRSQATQTHLRCLAHHGRRLLAKKVAGLELKDALLFSESSDENKVLELDELWSFVYRKSEKM